MCLGSQILLFIIIYWNWNARSETTLARKMGEKKGGLSDHRPLLVLYNNMWIHESVRTFDARWLMVLWSWVFYTFQQKVQRANNAPRTFFQCRKKPHHAVNLSLSLYLSFCVHVGFPSSSTVLTSNMGSITKNWLKQCCVHHGWCISYILFCF